MYTWASDEGFRLSGPGHLLVVMLLELCCQVIVDDDLPGILGFVNEEIKVEDS